MKKESKRSFRALLGFFSASLMLSQLAAAADDAPAVEPQSTAPTTGVPGSVIETLPAENQDQLQDSMATLQNQYDSETLSQMTLQIQDGKLIVVGVTAPRTTLMKMNPSGL